MTSRPFVASVTRMLPSGASTKRASKDWTGTEGADVSCDLCLATLALAAIASVAKISTSAPTSAPRGTSWAC
jgi:hypothetical protein